MKPDQPSVASPCINVCQMDAVTGLCQGCARTLAEIAAWSGINDAEKRGILAAVEQRRAAQASESSPPGKRRA